MVIKSSKTLVEEATKEITTLKIEEVKDLIDKKNCTLVDLRDIRELYNEGGVGGALHIPRGVLEFWVDEESPYYQENKFSPDKNIVDNLNEHWIKYDNLKGKVSDIKILILLTIELQDALLDLNNKSNKSNSR